MAALAGGPLQQVFNELALVLVLMGAGGGATRGLAIRLPWQEVLRGIVLGGLLAGGLGVLTPHILRPWIGTDALITVPALAAGAFLVGFLQDVVIARLQRPPQ
jgi:hypothetical protein